MTDPDLRIVSAGARPEEVAAVTAVLRSALDEMAAALDVEGSPKVSAWQRSQRAVRTPIAPGQGAWRSFSG
jgi:hypothetical protein